MLRTLFRGSKDVHTYVYNTKLVPYESAVLLL